MNEPGRGAAQDGAATRNAEAQHGSLRSHTTADINRQMRDLNQNSGSSPGNSGIPGGTLGKEEMQMGLRQAKAGQGQRGQISASKRAFEAEKQGRSGSRSGLVQPKAVSIIKNSNRDHHYGGPQSSSSRDRKMVSFSAERPV